MFIAWILNMQARAPDRNERIDHLKYLFFSFRFLHIYDRGVIKRLVSIYDASFHEVYAAEIVKQAKVTKFFRDT